MNAISPVLRQRLLSTGALLGFFVLWELACLAGGISDLVLPRPSQIAHVLLEKMPLLWPHTVQTLYTTLAGFVLGVAAGVLIGVAIGSSKLAYDVTYPLLVGFSSIPKVAVVPLFVVWFGAGTVPAILTSMVISIFPVVVNVATGLASTEPELEDVLRVLGAKRWDVLVKIGLPRSMPYFFGSLKVAITLAFVGTTVSEMTAANEGIGYLLISAGSSMQMGLAFAGLMVVGAMAMLMYELFSVIEKHTTGWAHRGSQNQ